MTSSMANSTSLSTQSADQMQALVACTQALAQLDGKLGVEQEKTTAVLTMLMKELESNQKAIVDQLSQQNLRIAQLESQQRLSEKLRVQEQQQRLRDIQSQQLDKKRAKENKLQNLQASYGLSHKEAKSSYSDALNMINAFSHYPPNHTVTMSRYVKYKPEHCMSKIYTGRFGKVYAYTLYTGHVHLLDHFIQSRDKCISIMNAYEDIHES